MHNDTSVPNLVALLRKTGARPRINSARVVRSTLYDLDYHVAVVACAFIISGERLLDDNFMLVAPWLKLLQFVAARPTLLPDFQKWAKNRRRPDLDIWQKMPRGYLGDRTHDRTIELLVAEGVLRRETENLLGGERFVLLKGLYDDVLVRDLLSSERRVLTVLKDTPVNRTLLKGQ